MNKRYYVYRFKNNEDIIIYVGRTVNLINRFKNHEHLTSDVAKIEYIECLSEAEMVWKEIYYINLYYNKLSKNTSDVYKNEKIKDIGLKDNWKDYRYFLNVENINNEDIERIYNRYVLNAQQLNYKELITIVNHYKLNSIGEDKYALSEKWFKDKPEKIKQLKNNILNYYINIINDENKSNKCLWTTYLQYYDKLKGKGYTKGFYYNNENKITNYEDRVYLAYLKNDFIGVNQSSNLTQDQYALTHLIHFIFKSGIREGKRITVYIPSKRMRELLIKWINEQKYEENK